MNDSFIEPDAVVKAAAKKQKVCFSLYKNFKILKIKNFIFDSLKDGRN